MFERREILFFGGSGRAAAPLSPTEEDLLKRSLDPGETVEPYLRGRDERVEILWALMPRASSLFLREPCAGLDGYGETEGRVWRS